MTTASLASSRMDEFIIAAERLRRRSVRLLRKAEAQFALVSAGLILSVPVLVPPAASVAIRAEPLASPAQDSQTEVSIVMSNPANHPRLGLPNLIVAGNDQEVNAAAKLLVLAASLVKETLPRGRGVALDRLEKDRPGFLGVGGHRRGPL